MANVKISALTALTSPAAADELPVVDVSATSTKKATVGNVVIAGAKELARGTAAAPAVAFGGATDANTGIYSPGADQLALSTNGTGQVFITSNGNAGIGTLNAGSVAGKLHLRADGDESKALLVLQNRNTGGSAGGAINFINGGVDLSDNRYSYIRGIITGAGQNGNHLVFGTNENGQPPSERLRIASSGRLLVGTSSARTNLVDGALSAALQIEGVSHNPSSASLIRNSADSNNAFLTLGKTRGTANGSNTIVQDNDGLGTLAFLGADGTNLIRAAQISASVDGTPGLNDMPGRLVFSTTADGASSPTERMRIDRTGSIGISGVPQITNIGASNTLTFVGASGNPRIYSAVSPGGNHIFASTSPGVVISFRSGTTTVGNITVTASATAYNTSSDYRLKENVTPVTDGITRLQQLKPSRFNFIADPDKTVDGFLAHEVQTIVPEAITGEKDAVDDEGNPEYQGIDQSKLVPLLTAALQEAVAKIESLEARLTAASI